MVTEKLPGYYLVKPFGTSCHIILPKELEGVRVQVSVILEDLPK